MRNCFVLLILIGCVRPSFGQDSREQPYWNTNLQIIPHRMAAAPIGSRPAYIDTDGDGDPDILTYRMADGTPVMWIDDNDNMKHGDMEGDVQGDCLLVDRNKDGKYGSVGDLVVDWVEPRDGQPGMQLIADYPAVEQEDGWPYGHYMWILDTDHDDVFNYIDWNTFKLKSWEHAGGSDFFPDYSGQSLFLKAHIATNRVEDLRLNWENPFLFYDPDGDGLSEMAIRFVDPFTFFDDPKKKEHPKTMRLSGRINWVSIAVDWDNDNRAGDEFDFDFTLGFRGEGFDYTDQVHKIDMHALPGTDSLFLDARWRHLDKLLYADHQQAQPLTFNRGKWKQVYFVFDEDDDCNRWERVEFYDPLDPFKIGSRKGGIDNNSQSDPVGDRGEWDRDNSGKGKLYVGRFDGRVHLYGAEWGCWRIDQTAAYYQGFDRQIIRKLPERFATVKYEDADHNGFLDRISYDLDGDTTFETVIDLRKLGIDDRSELIDVSHFKYDDYTSLQKQVSDQMWRNALLAEKAAKRYGLDLGWYAKWRHPGSARQRYHQGYWLQFYVYKDLEDLFLRQGDKSMLEKLNKAYYGGGWAHLVDK